MNDLNVPNNDCDGRSHGIPTLRELALSSLFFDLLRATMRPFGGITLLNL